MSEPARILVVDDTPANVKLLVDLLTMKGYAAASAVNGEDALAMIAAQPPDLVLLDIMMPGLSGYEVCRRIRANAETAAIPVVAFTASVTANDRNRITGAGFTAFIGKPINLKEFVETVRRVVDGGRR